METTRGWAVWFLGALTLGAAAVLTGCGGGSGGAGGAGGAAAGSTGNVAVLLTDAPGGEFDEVNVTLTRIELLGGDGDRATVFSGERTIDLLELQNHAELFSLIDVPVGVYEKIRLTVARLSLVKRDASGQVVAEYEPRLPGNGKIDLNPRTQFVVEQGGTLVLQIDLDAGKSIHVVDRERGEYNFRPVVFVDIVSGAVPGKFVKLRGDVNVVAGDAGGFALCRTEVDFDRDETDGVADGEDSDEAGVHGAGREQDQDEGEGGAARCLNVRIADDTAIFDADGAAGPADIMDGDLATVVGRLEQDGDGVVVHALVIELGLSGTFVDVEGIVTDGYDAMTGRFGIATEEDGVFAEGTPLSVVLLEGAKVLSQNGLSLEPDEIVPGAAVKLEALSGSVTDELQAAVVFVDSEADDEQKLSGTLGAPDPQVGGFMLLGTAVGDVCVHAGPETDIFQIMGDGGVSEEVPLAQLAAGRQADVYGRFDHTGCFEAGDVIAAAALP